MLEQCDKENLQYAPSLSSKDRVDEMRKEFFKNASSSNSNGNGNSMKNPLGSIEENGNEGLALNSINSTNSKYLPKDTTTNNHNRNGLYLERSEFREKRTHSAIKLRDNGENLYENVNVKRES